VAAGPERFHVGLRAHGRRYQRLPFCAYPGKYVPGNGHFPPFRAARRVGASEVDAAAVVQMEVFALTKDAPAEARHFAVDAMERLGAGHRADDVALIVTELASNAIRHARSGFTLVLSAYQDVVHIAVRDRGGMGSGERLPVAPMHGLGVVAALASAWGVASLGEAGKAVWAELKLAR
jgi:anti-sigma regulatory factor (Ser/Thr protein kinase)